MILFLSNLLLQVAIDSATPLDDAGPSENFMLNSMDSLGGYGGPGRAYGRMYGSPDFDDVSTDNIEIVDCTANKRIQRIFLLENSIEFKIGVSEF